MKNFGVSVLVGGGCGAGATWMVAYAVGFRGLMTALFALIAGCVIAAFIAGPKEFAQALRSVPEVAEKWYGGRKTLLKVGGIILLVLAALCVVVATWYACILAITKVAAGVMPPYTMEVTAVCLLVGGMFFAITLVINFVLSEEFFEGHRHSATRWVQKGIDAFNETPFKIPDAVVLSALIGCVLLLPFMVGIGVCLVPVLALVWTVDLLRSIITAFLNTLLRLAFNKIVSAAEGALAGGGLCLWRYWGSTEFLEPLLFAMVLGAGVGWALWLAREALTAKRGEPRLAY